MFSQKIDSFDTFDPVHAATTSCIVQGVTTTINPRDMAAIVLDAAVLSRLSWAKIWKQKIELQFSDHELANELLARSLRGQASDQRIFSFNLS